MSESVGLIVKANFPDRTKTIEDAGIRPTYLQIALWAAVVILTLALSFSKFGFYQPGSMIDDSHYIILAKSLATSPTFGMINVPGEPAPGKYPFVFPMALAPLIALFPGRNEFLPLTSMLATILNAVILFWGWHWFAYKKSYWWGLSISGLYLFSPLVMEQTLLAMSEALFLTFCLLAILFAEQYLRGKTGRGWVFFMALSLVAMAYTRSVGIPMAAFLVAYIFVRTRGKAWKDIFKLGGVAAGVLALIVAFTPVRAMDLLPLEYLNDENARLLLAPFMPQQPEAVPEAAFSSDTTLTAETAEVGAERQNIFEKAKEILLYGVRQHLGYDLRKLALPMGAGYTEQRLADFIGLPDLPQFIGYVVSALIIFGILRAGLRDGFSVFLIFAIVYFPMMFLWVWLGTRLLYPIQPQIQLGLLFALEGIFLAVMKIRLVHSVPELLRRAVPALVVCLLILMSAVTSLKLSSTKTYTGEIADRTAWFRQNANSATVVLSEFPEVDYLYSRTKTIGYRGSTTDSKSLAHFLVQKEVDFILVAPEHKWYWPAYNPEYTDWMYEVKETLRLLEAHQQIEMVYASSDEWTLVYRVLPDKVGSIP
jgi:hypothetical protein